MKKEPFNFAATMLMSAGAVVFNACSDDNTDSDGGVGTLEVTPASLETIADYGGSFSFDVRSNSYWHVSVEDADELPLDWASADIVSGMGNASVNLSVETNDGQAVRTGRIVFELDDMPSSRTGNGVNKEKKRRNGNGLCHHADFRFLPVRSAICRRWRISSLHLYV